MSNATLRAACMAVALATGTSACVHPEGGSRTPATQALQARVDALDHRRVLLEDSKDIKRLQRAYGYYLDRGLWDEAASLFASDGTIEMGLDGVYVGQARVRQYLRALGANRSGLAPGQLNQHMQLMPFVTVAADGLTAKATWRDVILAGQLGKGATWGEGPYENEYVKDHGVWKIKSLHWFQTLVVPYEGGWARHTDVNGGKYVSATLPPDRPPTIQYATWPGGLLPPFHFDQPAPAPDAVQAAGAGGAGAAASAAPAAQSPQVLGRRLAVLAQQVQLLSDQDDIEKLQRIYGYYLDKAMWSQAASLFSDDGEYVIDGRGSYVGKQRVLAYLRAIGPEFPQPGRLDDQMQLQPIVHVAPDGRTAKGRWRIFSQAALAGKFQEWGMSVAENDYVRDGGVWKIRRMHVFPIMFTPFEDGWGRKVSLRSRFDPQLPPDLPAAASTAAPQTYEGVSVPPFHYANPVTGAPVFAGQAAQFAVQPAGAPSIAELNRTADALAHRIGLLEDVDQLENLQMRYGYYLATLQWDRLANLFADNGTIQIALRGVYSGRASVRRSLNLYGEPGVHWGNLHNHMQYQPVIDVAPDGKTARLRARALSMMGNYGKSGMWMGGIYENQFIKVNGVWKFAHDQVFNNYFVPFDLGWKDLPPRAPPGISRTNPPDAPPTVQFQMYPLPTDFPAFHYDNPVTGLPTPILPPR